MSIIQVKNLTKKYGDFTAVKSVSFDIEHGETFGILGPNGAGKTTTLEMIEGLKKITGGQVLVDGKDVAKEPRAVKSIIGVQLQASSFFDGLNLLELIDTFAALYNREVNAREILREVQLEEKANQQVKELSGGQKQRLSIAIGLVNDPKIIFLDEPTTGLDPQARHNLWELIQQIKAKGKTVVLTTHYMEEAEVLCDRIAIMDHAEVVALNTPEQLLRDADVHAHIEFTSPRDIPLEALKKLPAAENAWRDEHTYVIVTSDPQATLNDLFHMTPEHTTIQELTLKRGTLEDVFLKLTGRQLRD